MHTIKPPTENKIYLKILYRYRYDTHGDEQGQWDTWGRGRLLEHADASCRSLVENHPHTPSI